jgi:hypothetical protein
MVALAVAAGLPLVHAALCHVTMRLFPRLILFYTGLVLLGIVTVAMAAAAAWVIMDRRHEDRFLAAMVVVAMTLASAGCTLAFFVIVPVTLDRSISTFLLSRMEGEGFSEPQLRQAFEREYVERNAAIARRLAEQLASGTIRPDDGGRFSLTDRGTAFLTAARMITRLYGVPPRYVTAAAGEAESSGE